MAKYLQAIFIVILFIFSSSSFVFAKFSIPGYVYSVGQLASARSVAENSNKPIAFVMSDKNTDCGLATAASKDLFQGLKNHSVVVYAEHKDWQSLPDVVKGGLNSAESGKFIPKTVVVDSRCKNIICIIPYAETKQRQQLIQQANQLLSSY